MDPKPIAHGGCQLLLLSPATKKRDLPDLEKKAIDRGSSDLWKMTADSVGSAGAWPDLGKNGHAGIPCVSDKLVIVALSPFFWSEQILRSGVVGRWVHRQPWEEGAPKLVLRQSAECEKTVTGFLRDAFMSALLEVAHAIGVDDDPYLIGADDNPYLIGADNDPCSRQGTGVGGSLRGAIVEFIRRGRTVRTSIQSLPFFSSHPFCRSRNVGETTHHPEDLNVIQESFSIPSNIVLSAPTAHETPRDNHPGYLCQNEYMLGVGVRIPFDFGVAEALWAFNVPLACVVPHSRKVIQTMAWYCEHRGYMADRCEARIFFARLTSEVDIWDVPERWEESLLDPVPRSRLSLPASQREEFFHWCESVHFAVAEEGERRALKRVRLSKEEGNLADSDSFIERAPRSSSSGQSTAMTELEGMASPLVVAQLKGELVASRAEGDVTRPSTVVEYLRSDTYRRRMEFKQAHHSESGYIRTLSDVAALYPKMDLSSLYWSP
ncbi:hypothetical protein ACLOJK_023975 [Asimina triloba]